MKLKIRNIEVNYEKYGDGTPVYFLHGLTLNLVSTRDLFEPILSSSEKKNLTRYYLDIPGMGETNCDDLNSSDDIIEILKEFILMTSGDQNVFLVGSSFGGYLSFGLNYLLPNKVKGLFLICPVVFGKIENRTPGEHKVIEIGNIDEDFIENIQEKTMFKEYKKMNVLHSPATWEGFKKLNMPGIYECNFDYLEHLQRDHHEYYQLTFESELHRRISDTPAVMLLGRNDHVVGYEDQLKILKSYPNASAFLTNDSGHNLYIDDPEHTYYAWHYFTKQIIGV